MSIWEPLLNNLEFNKQIEEKGHSKEIKFIEYIKENKLEQLMQRTGALTAQMLSIDFYSKQDPELTKKNLFITRTGQGKFIIFNQKFFNKPYLELTTKNTKEIKPTIPKGYEHLIQAYIQNTNENPTIEILHFLGIFKQIIKETTNEEEYYIGPRGNKTSKFDVYLHNKQTKNNEKIYTYNGQEELDYSLFTKKNIFIIEAKNQTQNGLDIGWHKISYPANRFKNLNKKIQPLYILKQKNQIYIYTFPTFNYNKNGINLNQTKDYTPKQTYKINLNELKNTTVKP